jgi:4-hydroxy-tetrahydrodipicolinate synthase
MAVPNGIYAPILTPVTSDLEIDTELLIEHAQVLIENGATGIAYLGTTGEANSFSFQQKKELIKAVGGSNFHLNNSMIGSGCASIKETIELTKYAVDHGLTHSLMLPPFYYKIVTDGALVDYYSQVIDTVNDDRLQIYMYHYPKMSTVPLSISVIQQLVKKYPTVVVGMKDSTGDFDSTKSYLEALPSNFQVFPGTENLLATTMPLGAAGCISATMNVSTKLIHQTYEKCASGESVEHEQNLITKRRAAFAGLSYPGALKGYLAYKNNDARWHGVMPPNELLGKEKVLEIAEVLDGLN